MRPLLAAIGFLLALGSALPCAAQGPAQIPAPAVADPSPENLALAQEIIRIGFPPASRRDMLVRTSDALMAQMREGIARSSGMTADPELQRVFDRYLDRLRTVSNEASADGMPAIFEAMARAYARRFSHDELVQIMAFVSTPAGARFFQQAPELLSDPDVAAANRAHMQRTFAALEPLITELRRDVDPLHHPLAPALPCHGRRSRTR